MEHWIDRARRYALENCSGDFKHCAIALDKSGGLLAIETNTYKSHPVQAMYAWRANRNRRSYLHAEIRALIKARSQVETLIVIRVNRQGQLKLSKPCPVCQCAIQDAGVNTIYYSTGEYDADSRICKLL